ncbi:PDZ domain-containing protein, partial [bacterium]|nr:PDZ domain-containing protein [bacterium]
GFPLNFGPTGIIGWFHGNDFIVTAVDAGSPAHGKVGIHERILAVNGRRFSEDADPRRIAGLAITESDKTGKLVLTIRRGGKEQAVPIALPVLGAYSPTWPYDCEKSRTILHNACQWLADAQLPSGAFMARNDDGYDVGPAMDGILLLASGDAKFLDAARRLAYYFADNPRGNLAKGTYLTGGTWMWGWAYETVFLSEYYLLTGDPYVLGHLRERQDLILAADHDCGSWCHGIKNTYYAVGGYINHIGITCLTALALIRECGLDVPQKEIDLSANYFRRFSVGGRHVHYGNHKCGPEWRPQGCGVGKDAIGAVVFEVLGDTATSQRFTRSVIDSYRVRDGAHAGPWLSLIWGPLGASRASDAEFRMFVDYTQWFHDLSRRWDGSFMLPSDHGGSQYTTRGPIFTMGGQALLYALPYRKTRITGARVSPFAAKDMPKQLRGVQELVSQRKWTGAIEHLESLLQTGKLPAAARQRAELMHDSLQNTIKSIGLTYTAIKADVAKGDLPMARNRSAGLGKLLNGRDGKRFDNEPKYKPIFDAQKEYEAIRDACFVDAAARKAMERIAADPKAGIVREKARKRLAEIDLWPSYRDTFEAESEYNLYVKRWERDKKNPHLLACVRKMAFGSQAMWPSRVAVRDLTAAGLLGERPNSTVLVPTSETKPQTWKTLAQDDEAPEGWQKTEFDDKAWKESPAPFLSGKGKNWNTKHVFLRKRFQAADPALR